MDLGGGRVGGVLGDGEGLVGEVWEAGEANINCYWRWECGEEISGEEVHHEQAVGEGCGLGSFVGVVGCEEEEEPFRGQRGL